MRDFLIARLTPLGPDGVDRMLSEGGFVDQTGRPIGGAEAYRGNEFVWFHRELREEPPVPFEVEIVHRDERIVVVDKPHFLSSIPRGRHVTESVVVRMRNQLGLPELGPAHRLDRLTAGLLVLTTERRWRAPYQQLFENRLVRKEYRAITRFSGELERPRILRSHIVKRRGSLQAQEIPGLQPNAETAVSLFRHDSQYAWLRLLPHTGRTHQLRVQLAGIGHPIIGDPLYPRVCEVDIDDFGTPLQLLASGLSFTDPVDGTLRDFTSSRQLTPPTIGA